MYSVLSMCGGLHSFDLQQQRITSAATRDRPFLSTVRRYHRLLSVNLLISQVSHLTSSRGQWAERKQSPGVHVEWNEACNDLAIDREFAAIFVTVNDRNYPKDYSIALSQETRIKRQKKREQVKCHNPHFAPCQPSHPIHSR